MLQYPYITLKGQFTMTNEELLEVLTEKFDKIDSRFDKIEKRLDKIEEECEITRDVTNKIGEWVDYYFHDDRPYPLDEDQVNLKFAK